MSFENAAENLKRTGKISNAGKNTLGSGWFEELKYKEYGPKGEERSETPEDTVKRMNDVFKEKLLELERVEDFTADEKRIIKMLKNGKKKEDIIRELEAEGKEAVNLFEKIEANPIYKKAMKNIRGIRRSAELL